MFEVQRQHPVDPLFVGFDLRVGGRADELVFHVQQPVPQNGVDDDDGAVNLVVETKMSIRVTG